MIEIDEPSNRAELMDAMTWVYDQTTKFWSDLPNDYFFKPYGEKWSPAENVVHLNKSTRPVAMAISLPRIVPRLMFGIRQQPSRSYSMINCDYQQALERGGQAGSYAPTRRESIDDPAKLRQSVMREWDGAWTRLIRSAQRWNDRSLDQLCLPHPLLGKLSVREMLYFTLYHHLHHQRIVSERLRAGAISLGING